MKKYMTDELIVLKFIEKVNRSADRFAYDHIFFDI